MVARADILAGRAVILIDIQDQIEKQLRGIRSKMRMFVSGISEVGGDLFRGGLASTIAAAFPVREFTNFQDQLLFLQTKLQETDESILPLEKTIRELGKTTSFSSKEVAQAATMYAQAGFKLKEVQNSLQAALDLARGGQVDLSTSTTILSNALRTFQKDASNAANFASKFITAARLGTLDIVDLGESLKYSSGTFANFGVSIEEVLGLITTLANSGLKASLAGTSLNTAFLNMASSADKLKGLLNVDLIEDDFKNPMKALRKMEEALKRFSKVEQADILQQILNIRGGRALQGLLLQGLDQVESNIKEIQKSSDEARKSAEKLDSRLGGVGRRALSAFQELNIAIGQTTEGPLTSLGERVAAIFNDMSRLATINPKVTQTLLLMAPAALAAGVGLLALTTIMGKLAMFITPLMMLNAALFKTAGAIVGVNIKQLSSLATFAKIQALSMKGITGPSINLGAGLTKGFNGILKIVPRMATQVGVVFSNTFSKVLQSRFAANIKWIFSPLMTILPVIYNVGRAISNVMLLLVGVVSPTTFTSIVAAIRSVVKHAATIRTVFQSIAVGAQLVAGQMMVTVTNMRLMTQMKIGDIFRQLAKLPQALSRINIANIFTSKIADSLVQGVAKGLIGINKVIKASPTLTGITQLGNALFGKQFGRQLKVGLGAQLAAAFKNIASGGLFKTVSTMFTSLFSGVGKGIRAIFSVNYLTGFISGFKGLWTIARGFLTVLNGVRRVLFSLSGWLLIVEGLILFGDKIPVVSDLLEKMGKAFSNLFSNIGQTLKNLVPSFGLIGKGISDIFGGKAERGVIRIKEAILDLGNTIRTGLSAAWAKFIEDMQPITDRVSQFVKGLIDIFNLLITAVGSIFGTIGDTIGSQIGSGGSAIDAAKAATSPENIASVFAVIGGAVVEIAKILMDILAAILSVTEVFNKGMGALIRWFSTTAVKDSQRNYWEAVASGFEMQGQMAGARVADLKGGRTAELEAAFNAFMESISPPGKTAAEEMADALFPEADFKAGLAEEAAAAAAERAQLAENWDMMTGWLKDNKVGEGLQAIEDFFKKFKDKELAAAVEEQAAQLESSRSAIGKAIVGDFESTRGQIFQSVPRMEKLQEKANEELGDINEGIASINNNKNPFVFNA